MNELGKEVPREENSGSKGRKIWIFQGNQDRYDLYNSLLDEKVKEAAWLVSRFKDEIHSGDIGLVWKAGVRRGIYAVGEIISNPQIMSDLEESRKYWKFESDRNKQLLRVKIRYKFRLTLLNAIESKELQKMPQLRNMEILKQSIGTNFRVTTEEWQAILGLLKDKPGFKE